MARLIHCPKCFHPQGSRAVLISHMHTAHVDGGLKCPRCPCTFALPRARLAHMIRIHRERYIVLKGLSTLRPCVSTPGWSPPSGLRLVCEDDDRKSRKSTTTTTIINKRTSDKNNKICRRVRCRRRQDCQEEIVKENDSNLKIPPCDDENHPVIKSNTCSSVADHHSSEIQHSSQSTTDNITEEELVPIESKRPQQVVWYKCKMCGYRSLEKQPLAIHMVSYHDFNNLRCTICSLNVLSAAELEIHYRDTHRTTIARAKNDTTNNVESSTSIVEMDLGDLYMAGVDLKSSKPTKYLTHSDDDSFLDDDDDDVVVVDFVKMERKPIDPEETPTKQWIWANPQRDEEEMNQLEVDELDVHEDSSVKPKIVELDEQSSEEKGEVVTVKTNGLKSVKKAYQCKNCDIIFASVQSRHRHLKRSHVANGKFKCNLCTCVFDKPKALKGHLIRHHYGLENVKSSSQLKIEEQLRRRLIIRTLKMIRSRK